MTAHARTSSRTLLSLGLALGASLPTALAAQARPAIRQLGAITATTSDSLGMVSNVRALPGGRLLINDASSRRVVLVDSTMKILAVVADSTTSTANAYGPRPGSLVAYRGDSTLFIDPASLSMLVIDPQGKVGRVMSVPRAQDANMLASGLGAYYSNGHLVYRGNPGVQMRATGGSGNSAPQITPPESLPIIRVNLQSRVVDTVGFTKIPKTNTNMQMVDGKMSISIEVNPLPTVDEWVVTSSGDVAIIRGRDYHVDWVSPDKQVRSSPKVAFDWKRLSDEEKTQLVDSVSKIFEKQFAAGASGGQALQQGFQTMMGGSAAGAAPAAPQVMMRFEVSAAGGGGAGGPVRAPQVMAPKMSVVPASELPDYQPPFFAGSARADQDGNIWVRTIPTKPQPAGEVYDVLNAKGEAVDRVLVPQGKAILGFGPGGVVYLAERSGLSTKISRATLK
ncbi:MAG: hypothetical protein LCH84_18535 [Gemmatimonadetes bacterium]|nr:hypothetical protein [Gemmatimonadota bacterium]